MEMIYKDYANYLIENHELIINLKSKNSPIYDRIKYVDISLEHLYSKCLDDSPLDEEEQNIFEVGFYFLHDQISNIQSILEMYCGNSIEKLERHAITVNQLLYFYTLSTEILLHENVMEDHEIALTKLEDKIVNFIKDDIGTNKNIKTLIDDVITNIYTELQIEHYGIVEIFYDVADTLNLLTYEEAEIGYEI